jgi:Flp pilus assembly protein TadD
LPTTDTDSRRNPLTVYVVSGLTEVRRLYSGSTDFSGVAGFYMPSIAGPVAFVPGKTGSFDLDAMAILFHEYTHHFTFRNFSTPYPTWYAEGFAELMSTVRFDSNGDITVGLMPREREHGLTRANVRIPIEVLLAPPKDYKFDLRSMDVFYGRSWLLAHYLNFSDARMDQLPVYLKALGGGTPSLEAAKTAFGDLSVLDRELDNYVRQIGLKAVRLGASQTQAGSISVRALSAGEAAMMPVRMASKRGVTKETAQTVVVDARRLAAPYANDPRVQDALAEAEFDAGNDALAEAAADRALAADPDDRVAMLYKGQVQMRREQWADARGWFLMANRVAPNDPQALQLYYRSFLAQGTQPSATAITALGRAFALMPEVQALRFMYARQILRDGDGNAARTLLAPLAFGPHARSDNPAAKAIAAIDVGDTEGALRELGLSQASESAED